MRQFILATGFNADLADATAGQLAIVEAGTDNSAGGYVGLNLVLKRDDAKGGNILYPIYPKDFTWVKSVYNAGQNFEAVFTVKEVEPYLDYTVIFVKKGKLFNERSNWTAVIHSKATDTAETIAAAIKKYVDNNKAKLGLVAAVDGAEVTITGTDKNVDYSIKFGDELFGTEFDETVVQAVAPRNDAAMIKDMFNKCAADAGFEYTYDDFDIYPGFEFNPLAQADAVDAGFMVYTLRFTEPRVMGTREEEVYQIVQVAFPTETDVTDFEEELDIFMGKAAADEGTDEVAES